MGQVLERVLLEHIALGIDITFLRRPQRQGADRVGKARTLDGIAFGFEFLRGGVVGAEEHFERRAVLDLGIELPGGTVGGDQLVTGVLLEIGGNRLDRCGEVGGDGHLDFIGVDRSGGDKRNDGRQAGANQAWEAEGHG